jgi:CheY-like chemotaxis protein
MTTPPAQLRILVVDDHKALRSLLSLNTPNNYSPCGAADRKVPPDLR